MARKPRPPKDSDSRPWSSEEQRQNVARIVKRLRRVWRGYDKELTHLLNRTLIGLEISYQGDLDSMIGTVKSLEYFAPSDVVYCTIWINPDLEETFIITGCPFRLTKQGREDWEKAVDGVRPLENAPNGVDWWLQDTELDGFIFMLVQKISERERLAPVGKESAMERERNFFPVPSHVFENATHGNEIEAMTVDAVVSQLGDGFPRDRLLAPACIDQSHWILLEIKLDTNPAQVRIIDSLRPVISEQTRATCPSEKVKQAWLRFSFRSQLRVFCRVMQR